MLLKWDFLNNSIKKPEITFTHKIHGLHRLYNNVQNIGNKFLLQDGKYDLIVIRHDGEMSFIIGL